MPASFRSARAAARPTVRAAALVALAIGTLALTGCRADPAATLPPPDTTAFRADAQSFARDTSAALPTGTRIDLALPTPDGRDTVDLADLRGKVVLVNFWATWCGPCREEIPDFLALRRDLGARGLEIVGVSMDLDAAPVAPFVREMGISYPIVLAGSDLPDRLAGLMVLPTTLVLDRDGRLVRRLPGRFQTAELRPLLDELLAVPAAR